MLKILFLSLSLAQAIGTPKTLNEAVQNGVDRSIRLHGEVVASEVEKDVTDFMAQKFSIMTMLHQPSEDVLIETYNLIRRKPGCDVFN